MRLRTALCRAALLAALLSPGVGTAAEEVVWVYPPPNSLITESPVAIYGYLARGAETALEAKVVGADGSAPPTREALYLFKGRIFSGSIPLSPGRNNVVVAGSVLPLLYRPGAQGSREGDFRRPDPHGKKIDSCSDCHAFAKGSITLKQPLPDLCLACHKLGTESPRAAIQKNEHTRKVNRDCLRCHLPHASFEAKLLQAGEEVCGSCHPTYRKYFHGPREGGTACGACHDAHASGYPKMLKGEAAELCRKCHRGITDPQRYPRSYHLPVQEQHCFDCHAPHPAGARSLLKAAVPGLCRGCHKQEKEGLHQGRLEECRICHESHLSNRPKLLTEAGGAEACAACHAPFPEGKSRHPALKDGCGTCHDPHSPKGSIDTQKACGRCHRLNDQTFQSVHGMLPMASARQCSFCHEPHTSNYPTLLRGAIHYPLKNGGCGACHTEKGGKLELRYEGSKNCLRCHGQMTGTSSVIDVDKAHKPVFQIDCIACHNPHLGVRPKFLLEDPVVLCGWCHGILLKGVENIHGVFRKDGTCYTCHVPHISDYKPLLKGPELQLCTRCHTKVLPEDPPAKRLLHGVMTKGRCTDCHNPHGTNTEKLLGGTRDALCLGCHRSVTLSSPGTAWKYVHGPVGAGNCTACHVLGHRHGGENDHFLKLKGSRVCALCHDTRPEHVRENYRAKMREVQNECLACHLPHGADNAALIRTGR